MAFPSRRQSSATRVTILAKNLRGDAYLSNNVAIISCGSRPWVFKLESNLYGTLNESKKYSTTYIKVHDPCVCRCQYRIPASWEAIIQQPEHFIITDVEAEEARTGMAKPGATIFNSIYFRRRDGVMRNALGGVLESKSHVLLPVEDVHTSACFGMQNSQTRTLKDLISIEWGTSTFPDSFANRRKLAAMLSWSAEMYET